MRNIVLLLILAAFLFVVGGEAADYVHGHQEAPGWAYGQVAANYSTSSAATVSEIRAAMQKGRLVNRDFDVIRPMMEKDHSGVILMQTGEDRDVERHHLASLIK